MPKRKPANPAPKVRVFFSSITKFISILILRIKVIKMPRIEVNEKEKYVIVRINPKIYPLDIVYSAAYIMLDEAYILLDGDPDKEIVAEIRPKKNQELQQLAMNFNDELLNYAVYKTQSEKNREMREIILQRAILTNNPDYFVIPQEQVKDEPLADPENIAKTWQEKDGKEDNNQTK